MVCSILNGISIWYSSPKTQEPWRKRGETIVKASGSGHLQGKYFPGMTEPLHTWIHRSCDNMNKTYLDRTDQNPSMDGEWAYEAPSLAKELLVVDRRW